MLPWWCGYLKAANSPVEGGQELILKKVISINLETQKILTDTTERWLAICYKSTNITANLKSKNAWNP